MEDLSQNQVTNKMFYEGQVAMRDLVRTSFAQLSIDLKEEVTNQIKITVNGKIDRIAASQADMKQQLNEQDEFNKEHFEKVDIHMAGVDVWKTTYSKYLTGLANVTDGSKIIAYIIVTIAAVGAAFLTIRTWFK